MTDRRPRKHSRRSSDSLLIRAAKDSSIVVESQKASGDDGSSPAVCRIKARTVTVFPSPGASAKTPPRNLPNCRVCVSNNRIARSDAS